MARATGRTVRCDGTTRAGRLAKARQFLHVADLVSDLGSDETDLADATVTLYVHAGIAAADVICCARLGEHAHGESHDQAVGLLARADKELAPKLRVLLGMKSRAGYSSATSSATDRKQAQRAALALVSAAESL